MEKLSDLVSKITAHFYLILILAITFVLRFVGIRWGFPGTLHNDESVIIRSSLGMRFGDLNPGHFDWPSLYFYLNYFLFFIFIKARIRLQVMFGTEKMEELFPFWWGAELPFYYLGRFLSISFSLGIIVMAYAISENVFKDRRISIFTALILGIGYWTNYMSYYALAENALVFFMLISFYFSVNIVGSDRWRNYILAAVFAGLATSTKYNGALICFAIPIAHILREGRILSVFNRKVIIAAIISVFFFWVGTPYAFLDWDSFSHTESAEGAFWQIRHIGFGLNWFYHLGEVIPKNFGALFALLSFIGAGLLLFKKDKYKKLISITVILMILYIGTWGIRRAHYSMPVLPFLALTGSYMAISIYEKIKNKYLGLAFLIFLAVIPLYSSLQEAYIRSREDTRAVSGKWIEDNLEKGTTIFVDRTQTGIYGGTLPIFDNGNYNVVLYPDIFTDLPVEDAVSIQVISEKGLTDPDLWYIKNMNEILYVDNHLRMGPVIRILEVNEDNISNQ